MLRQLSLFFISCSVLTACELPPDAQKMQQDYQVLNSRLVNAQQQIHQLEQNQQDLKIENTELKRIFEILNLEKDSRVDESTELRLHLRRFAQSQIDSLKGFMLHTMLLDYVGEELVERVYVDDKSQVLVDFENAIPRSGSLMGVSGYFTGPTEFSLDVLRPVDDRYVVVWQSQVMSVAEAGSQRVRFPVSVGVEQGDVIAYSFPLSVGVKYDLGTGSTLLSKKPLELGGLVEPKSLHGEDEKRAYSLGVIAILE